MRKDDKIEKSWESKENHWLQSHSSSHREEPYCEGNVRSSSGEDIPPHPFHFNNWPYLRKQVFSEGDSYIRVDDLAISCWPGIRNHMDRGLSDILFQILAI